MIGNLVAESMIVASKQINAASRIDGGMVGFRWLAPFEPDKLRAPDRAKRMAKQKKAAAATKAKKPEQRLSLKNVPTTEFQRNYAKYLSAVRKGKTVTISYRGSVVAKLAPVP